MKKSKQKKPTSFGQFYRKHLGDSPLSDHSLAIEIGVSASSLAGYYNGTVNPAHINQMKIIVYISKTKKLRFTDLYLECLHLAQEYNEIKL